MHHEVGSAGVHLGILGLPFWRPKEKCYGVSNATIRKSDVGFLYPL